MPRKTTNKSFPQHSTNARQYSYCIYYYYNMKTNTTKKSIYGRRTRERETEKNPTTFACENSHFSVPPTFHHVCECVLMQFDCRGFIVLSNDTRLGFLLFVIWLADCLLGWFVGCLTGCALPLQHFPCAMHTSYYSEHRAPTTHKTYRFRVL